MPGSGLHRRVRAAGGRARFLRPRPGLAGALFAAIVRDTRGAGLDPGQRFNHFPASPLVAITWVRQGRLHLADADGTVDPAPLPPVFVSGPSRRPMVSWSDGGVWAMTLGLYPEAWTALTGIRAADLADGNLDLNLVLHGELLEAFGPVGQADDLEDGFAALQDRLAPLWLETCPQGRPAAARLAAWIGGLAARAAVAGMGRSDRQAQRRIKAWTGQALRDLRPHARLERLAEIAGPGDSPDSLAQAAADAGYADQSHMGREVRRLTGQSPARLGRLIRSDERFWFYRSLGERS